MRGILGERVLQLEHVGSTSVPGLPAKPIIDMLLVVADSADEPAYVPSLEAGGYVLRIREPDWHEHRLFKGPTRTSTSTPSATGRPRSGACSPSGTGSGRTTTSGNAVLQTKRELAARHWVFVQDYADAKGEVVEGIIGRAMAEAAGIASR